MKKNFSIADLTPHLHFVGILESSISYSHIGGSFDKSLPTTWLKGYLTHNAIPLKVAHVPSAKITSSKMDDDGEKQKNAYMLNAFQSLLKEQSDSTSLLSRDLTDFLTKNYPASNDKISSRPQILIFDQLEELFTFYPNDEWREQQSDFFEQVAKALKNIPSLRMIFVIREDYLAELDPFLELLPERLRPRFRLERLRKQNAFLAIQKPLESMEPARYNSHREQIDTAISKIIKDLVIVKSVDPFTGDNNEVAGEFVEPIHLQIVCQRWWRGVQKLSTGYENFSSKVPSVDESLKELYESTIREVVSDKISEGMIRKWCGTKLITPSGTRGFVHLTHQLSENEIDSCVTDVFEKEHLIRSEWRSGALWYELTHDRLIQPIKKSNEKWQQQQHQKEVANSIALSNAKIRHYKKIMYVSISVCAAILIGVVIHLNPISVSNSCVVGVSPIAVNFNPNSDTIYVANKGSNSISVIGKDCKTVQDIKVGKDPVGVTVNPNSNIIYVPNSGEKTVSVINGTTNALMKTVQVGVNPNDVAVNPNTDTIYVTNKDSNTVSVIDGKTNAVVNVPVGKKPTGVAVNRKTDTVYVANKGFNTVSVINSTNAVVRTVEVGSMPALPSS